MNLNRLSLRVLLSFATLACVACSPSSDAPTPQAVAPTEDLTLEVANRAKLDEVLTGLRGKVVLVDYWQTSCIPCVEKLPAILALKKELGDRGLQVVTLSLDDPDASVDIRDLLKGKGAAGLHLISEFGTSPQSLEEFEIDLVPYYRLYNREGEIVETFQTGPDTPKIEVSDIQAAIERLL